MRFLKTIILPVWLTAAWLNGQALTPRQAFISAPDDVIATVDSITRLDMLDYYDSGSSVASRNAFGGDTSVKSLNDVSITVALSKASEVTIVPLEGHARGDSAILVINTLALPTPDSYAVTYDRQWHLDTHYSLPDHNNLDLWILPDGNKLRDKIENAIPFIPAIYTYHDGVLTMTQTLSKLNGTDEYNLVKP
ncbi:MAG: DUF3256 family protein, partial [Muribaculaceae bacterium]|nr:DUF3256 family protein [Muribaculaceae bacterium]